MTFRTSIHLSKIFCLPKLLFVFPCKQKKLHFSLSRKRLGFLTLLAILMMLICWKLFFDHFYDTVSNNLWFCYKVLTLEILFSSTASVLWIPLSLSQLNTYARTLGTLDCSMSAIGLKPRSYSFGNNLKIVFQLFVLAILISSILAYIGWDWDFLELLYFTVHLLIVILVSHIIYGLLSVVKDRLTLIIEAARCIENRKRAFYILHLVSLYNLLFKICGLLNDFSGPQMLVLVANIFINSVTNFYFIFTYLQESHEHLTKIVIEVFNELLWALVNFVSLQDLILLHTEVSEKAKQFNKLLYRIMLEDTTGEIANNKKLRLHLAMKREAVFTACGFFTIDYTLIHSMIAAATTYLVILIQFGVPPDMSIATTDASAMRNRTNSSA